jgi:hypothetical protein
MSNHGGKRKGSGRKTKHGEPTVFKGVRVPVSLDNQIQGNADQANVSWSEYLIKFLQSKLK